MPTSWPQTMTYHFPEYITGGLSFSSKLNFSTTLDMLPVGREALELDGTAPMRGFTLSNRWGDILMPT